MVQLSPEMNSELRKAVTSFNRKIKRLQKKGVNKGLLPEKVSVRELKSAYSTNEALEDRLLQMSFFSSKGLVRRNKKGVLGTDIAFQYADARNAHQRQVYESQLMASYGQKSKYKSQLRAYKNNLKAKIKYLDHSTENLDARTIQYQKANVATPEKIIRKNKIYRQNYYQKMYEYGEIGKIDPKRIKVLEKKLDTIPDADFFRVVETNPEFSDIQDYMYESPPVSAEGIKRARPKYDPKDVQDSFEDLISNADKLIANSL